MLKFWFVAVAVALTGPANAKEKIIPDSVVPFDPAEAAWAAAKGSNTIVGNAMLRTVGGDIKTCAGFEAALVPVTRYGEGRVNIIYGSSQKGYNPLRTPRVIAPASPAYNAIVRTTTCDSLGNFEFNGLPSGEYFIQSVVSWGVPTRYFTRKEGGVIFLRVKVEGGETKRVVLTM